MSAVDVAIRFRLLSDEDALLTIRSGPGEPMPRAGDAVRLQGYPPYRVRSVEWRYGQAKRIVIVWLAPITETREQPVDQGSLGAWDI